MTAGTNRPYSTNRNFANNMHSELIRTSTLLSSIHAVTLGYKISNTKIASRIVLTQKRRNEKFGELENKKTSRKHKNVFKVAIFGFDPLPSRLKVSEIVISDNTICRATLSDDSEYCRQLPIG